MKRPLRSLMLALALFIGIGFACPPVNAMMDAGGAPYVVSTNVYVTYLTVFYVTHWSNGDTTITRIGL